MHNPGTQYFSPCFYLAFHVCAAQFPSQLEAAQVMMESDNRVGFFQQIVYNVSWELPRSKSQLHVSSAATLMQPPQNVKTPNTSITPHDLSNQDTFSCSQMRCISRFQNNRNLRRNLYGVADMRGMLQNRLGIPIKLVSLLASLEDRNYREVATGLTVY